MEWALLVLAIYGVAHFIALFELRSKNPTEYEAVAGVKTGVFWYPTNVLQYFLGFNFRHDWRLFGRLKWAFPIASVSLWVGLTLLIYYAWNAA